MGRVTYQADDVPAGPIDPQGNRGTESGYTVRQRVMLALKTMLEDMMDDTETVWKNVYWGDLEDQDNTVCPAAAVDFGTEELIGNTFPCSTYQLPVFFNFRFVGARGVDEHMLYMYYLGLLQSAMLGDHNIEGLTLDVQELTNSHTIIGVESVYPGGSLIANVIYKTRLHNPYKSPHEA